MSTENEQPDFAPEPVNSWAVRLESVRKGTLRFLKNGLIIGSVAGLALTGAAVAAGVAGCSALGPVCAVLGVGAWASGNLGTVALGAAKYSLLAVGGGAVLGGAVGSAIGAVHGFADAENDINKAHVDAKMVANQKKMEFHRQQEEALALEQQKLAFARQTEQMGLNPGQLLASPQTPQLAQNTNTQQPAFNPGQ